MNSFKLTRTSSFLSALRVSLPLLVALLLVLAPVAALSKGDPVNNAPGKAAVKAKRGRAKIAAEWDTNKNGKLDAAERKLARERLLGRWDNDGDGLLNASELQAARLAGDLPRKRGKLAQRAASQAQRDQHTKVLLEKYDRDGDGKISPEEMSYGLERKGAERAAAQRRANIERYDADGDGKLSDEERQTLRRENGIISRDEVRRVLDASAAESVGGGGVED